MTRNSSNSKKFIVFANILLLLGLAGSTGYLFMENRDLNSTLSLSEQDRQKIKNDKYITEINKTLSLPEEEPLYVINVIDPEAAKKDSPELVTIFGDIQKDDFILVYKKAKLAIQYRPSEKKVIKTNTIKLPITVELVGSEKVIEETKKKLAEFGNQITITKTIKDGITQSYTFDIDGDQSAEAKSIADLLEIEIGSTLPESIKPTDQTEIVIVLAGSASVTETPATQEP